MAKAFMVMNWKRHTYLCLLIVAIAIGVIVRFAYLNYWPDNAVHEDSSPYLTGIVDILDGKLSHGGIIANRPLGTALFYAGASLVTGAKLIRFIVLQHGLTLITALCIATILRMAGANAVIAALAVLMIGISPRLIHYDNTLGAETLVNCLTALAALTAFAMERGRLPRGPGAVILGVLLGYLLITHEAGLGAFLVILFWLALPLWDMVSPRWKERLGTAGLALGIAFVFPLMLATYNWSYRGDFRLSKMGLSDKGFVIAYSGDFNGGVHADRKLAARDYVELKRSIAGPTGYPDSSGETGYQWPPGVYKRLVTKDDPPGTLERVVNDIFWETVTTPRLLWNHITGPVRREMTMLLFDGNSVAGRAPNPMGYESLAKRDAFPRLDSPNGYKRGELAEELIPNIPGKARVIHVLNSIAGRNYDYIYVDGPQLIHPIRWISPLALAAAGIVIVLAPLLSFLNLSLAAMPLISAAALLSGIWIANGFLHVFLVYALNRYSYYVIPFLIGGALCFVEMAYRSAVWASSSLLRKIAAAGPANSGAPERLRPVSQSVD